MSRGWEDYGRYFQRDDEKIYPPNEGEDGYSIACHGWMPGTYETFETAELALATP